MSRAVVLLSLMCLFQDETQVTRWVADLGHEELARRESAQASLLKAGEKALEALRKSLGSADPEKAIRIRSLLEEIERPAREKKHDARQRLLRLRLVTLDFKDGKLSDVLKDIGSQLQIEFDCAVDATQRVSVEGKELPLRQVFDSIERALDVKIVRRLGGEAGPEFRIRDGRYLHLPRMHLRGATFEFRTKEVKVDGKTHGWRLEAQTMDGDPLIESVEVNNADGTSQPFEQCGACGPALMFIRREKPEEVRLKLRGGVRWSSVYEFDVSKVDSVQTFRVGPYRVGYEFPTIRISSDQPVDSRLFAEGELQGVQVDPDADLKRLGGRFGMGVAGPPQGWCRCSDGPVPLEPRKPHLITEDVTSNEGWKRAGPSAFRSMKVMVRRYFLEPFEGEVIVPLD